MDLYNLFILLHNYLPQKNKQTVVVQKQKKQKKVRRYICLEFSPSAVPVAVGGFEQWYHCQRDIAEDERQTGFLTETWRKRGTPTEGFQLLIITLTLDTEHPSPLFIGQCLLRELEPAVVPLTCLSSIIRWVNVIPVKLRVAFGQQEKLKIHPCMIKLWSTTRDWKEQNCF